jgi:hypothetical protein
VVQEKPPDEREGWEKLNDKSKLQKMLKWKNSQNEQKSLEGDTIFKLNTKAAGPKLGMDQSYEVGTEFGPVRFASGDQRWVDDGMAFFDKVTHIVEHDKERRARLLLWDLMAKSLVGAEVSSICKMCPIQGDIAYVYTKVREWAELVNPFTYFNQVRAYFTKEYNNWTTVEALMYELTQAAEEIDRMGAALKVEPWAAKLKREMLVSQLLSRYANDVEEFKYLSETVLRLWEAQVKDSKDAFTAEKVVGLYSTRAIQMRDMRASKIVSSTVPIANAAQDAASSDSDNMDGAGGGDPATKVDQRALVAALTAMGIKQPKKRPPRPPKPNIRRLIGEDMVNYCMSNKICMSFQAGQCTFPDCMFKHRLITKEEMESTVDAKDKAPDPGVPPGGAPMAGKFPVGAICPRCKGTKCGKVCYTVICAACGLVGHHHRECDNPQPRAMMTIVDDMGDILVEGEVGYLQYDYKAGAIYNGQTVQEFSGEGDEELYCANTVAI